MLFHPWQKYLFLHIYLIAKQLYQNTALSATLSGANRGDFWTNGFISMPANA
jgi:hypothetical protein